MGHKKLNLITHEVSKGMINKDSLRPILEHDSDFSENEEYYREGTLNLGFDNEADRVATEIYNEHSAIGVESEMINAMAESLFKVDNFIGNSGCYYGQYEYRVLETEFTYIIIIAYITNN